MIYLLKMTPPMPLKVKKAKSLMNGLSRMMIRPICRHLGKAAQTPPLRIRC